MAAVVLVHGAWHGPWCWHDVAEALRAGGHDVSAITLPGHDRPGRHGRIWNRISQYIDAVGDAVAATGEPPILVGHSMGGYTVQRYLETNAAAAGVLVASVPWRGTLRPNLRAMRRRPRETIGAALLVDYSRMIRSPELVRELFFTDDTSQTIVDATTSRLQNESALAINTMAFRRIRTAKVTTPMFVIGAGGDSVFSVDEQRELAAAYGGEAEILAGGHDLMLDGGWPELAAAIGRIARTI